MAIQFSIHITFCLCKKNIFLLFLLFTAVSLQAQYPLLSKDAEISLLTVSPSEDEVYTVYGHTALRVRDASKKPRYRI